MSGPLERVLGGDPDVAPGSLRTATDKTLSIGRDVWRLRWRHQHTTAVDADAGLHTTCGALLDAITVLVAGAPDGNDVPVDLTGVNLLIARPVPRGEPSETDQALRSLRDAAIGLTARVWYLDDRDRWTEDTAQAPTWEKADPRTVGWVRDLLLPRLITAPSAFARELVDAVDDPSLHLYPSLISSIVTDTWALRIDGLQIGTTVGDAATLTIGQPGRTGDGPQRRSLIDVFGSARVTVNRNGAPDPGVLTIAAAADRIRQLLRQFRSTNVPGEPIAHRRRSGAGYIDEHGLEARLLKGIVAFQPHRHSPADQLVLSDEHVARGSQFPTLWAAGAKPRYLDALMASDGDPVALELKTASGGQGRYYRRALVQAVLYRHFLTHAPALDPWFDAASLTRTRARAAIGIPIPHRWLPKFDRDLALLHKVASYLGASVHVLDDRATPEWTTHEALPDVTRNMIELHTWRLVDALGRRWPRSLGRVVELHGAGGFYDQIELRHRDDHRLTLPALGPQVSLNRPGSLWIFAQDGSTRWVWRGIWEHLAAGGDIDEAAATIGAIAGLPDEHPATGLTFGAIARDFLLARPSETWEWRCAWPWPQGKGHWVEPYAPQLTRYRKTHPDPDTLPSIARIWGAVRDNSSDQLLDQHTLRTFHPPGAA